MASPASSLSRSALKARDALVLEHLSLADAIAAVMARCLFPLVEREDLIQVAREDLVRSAPCCRAGEPTAPYLRRCITGALQHHLRDRVRLVHVPRRLHEQGQCPLGHISLDGHAAGEPCLLDQLASPEPGSSVAVSGQIIIGFHFRLDKLDRLSRESKACWDSMSAQIFAVGPSVEIDAEIFNLS
jgi:DNA-directed RNA polymerase specialized sigma24 family protein